MPGYATSPLLYWVWFCNRLQGFWGLGCGVDLAPVIEDDTAYANCRFSFLRCMMRNYAHITCESPNSCTVTSRHVNQARNDWIPHTVFNKGLIGRFKVQGSGDACVMCCWAQWTWMVLYYADRLPLWVEDRGINKWAIFLCSSCNTTLSFYSTMSNRSNNPGNFANRSHEEVESIAAKGGHASHSGGFHNMDPQKQARSMTRTTRNRMAIIIAHTFWFTF